MEKVKRLISWFDKTTEELKGEKDISKIIELNQLKTIFSPMDDDPWMVFPYSITQTEARKLNRLVEIDFDFDRYIYQLDCFKADG